jgi:hypothetical protein
VINNVIHDSLRISLFRIDPDPLIENVLLTDFKDRVGNDNLAIFKALGHYDIICFYPNNDRHEILFGGTIKGIRSFSNLDCLTWGKNNSMHIIKKLKHIKFITIVMITCNNDILMEGGGIQNEIILSLITEGIDFYLNSPSWGEHILVISAESMSNLIYKFNKIINQLKGKTIDIHSVTAINMLLIKDIDAGTPVWDEPLPPDNILEWHVHLLPNSLNDFNKIVAKFNSINLRPYRTFSTSADTQAVYTVKANTWEEIIKDIRLIRGMASDLLVSTKLNIYHRAK